MSLTKETLVTTESNTFLSSAFKCFTHSSIMHQHSRCHQYSPFFNLHPHEVDMALKILSRNYFEDNLRSEAGIESSLPTAAARKH